METIRMQKNGVITQKGRPVTGSPLKLLGSTVKPDADITLASFFMMIEQYPALTQLSDMLDALLEIASKSGMSGLKTDEIESLVFYKTIEITGFPGKPGLTFYNTLKGVRKKEDVDLKFFHLESLLDHTLALGSLKHIVFGDKEDVFQYKTFYTLFELVEGITWELSFNFNPLQCSIRR